MLGLLAKVTAWGREQMKLDHLIRCSHQPTLRYAAIETTSENR
jgi:hypothetical protein